MIFISGSVRRAFSLIESAIVLGVIGLVIGGIWVAAVEVNYRHKLNQTVQGVGILVDDFRNVYSAMTPSNIACGAVWVNTKIFPNSPPGWTLPNSGYPQDPWGNGIYIDTGCAGSNNRDIEFYFYNLPLGRCIDLRMRISRLPNYNGSIATLSSAESGCKASTTASYSFMIF